MEITLNLRKIGLTYKQIKLNVIHDKLLRNDHGKGKVPEARGNGQPTAGIINIIIVGIVSEGDSNGRCK